MKEKLDKIEFILEHLREPERLLQEEFVSWLQEEENKHLFEEVTTNRMAFLQKEYGQQIEPELEAKIMATNAKGFSYPHSGKEKNQPKGMVFRGSRGMRADGFSRRFVVTTRERKKISFPYGSN